jgi:rubrerythrin
MQLGTAGAVLSFAIKLEGQAAEFYDGVASLTEDSRAIEELLWLAEAKTKRKARVERSRREFVNEMLLEPIAGLDASDYLTGTKLTSDMDSHTALRLATELEENSQALYLDAAEKISHLPQLARVFKKLGQESADHKLRLESLGGKEVSEG